MTLFIIDAIVAASCVATLLRGVALRTFALIVLGISVTLIVVCSAIGTFEFGPHIEIDGWKVGATLIAHLIFDALIGAGIVYVIDKFNGVGSGR